MNHRRLSVMLLFPIALLCASCSSKETLIGREDHFFIPFGNTKGKLGLHPVSQGQESFALDQLPFAEYLCFDRDRVAILDTVNNKLLVFEYGGRLLLDIPLAAAAPAATPVPARPPAAAPRTAPTGESQYSLLATDSDRRLYYIRSRQAGTVLHYSLCRVLPNEEAVVEILLNRSVETGPAAGSISRIQKLVPAGPDEIALVWETLYREASEEESLVRISHLEYVNLKEKTARTAELRPAMFTTPADLRHEKVAAVFPSWKKPGVFIETVQAGEKKMGRAFFFLNAENGALEAVRLPVDNWSAVLGVDEDDQVFLLEQVVPRDDKIRALFRVHDRRQDKDRFFAIQSDPAESFMGNFFFASSGRIFSYLLSSDGIQIVSWK